MRRIDTNEVIADGISAVLGGSDTGAAGICHIWYYLMKNPEYCERLRKEIQAAFSEDEQPRSFERLQLPYLEACMSVPSSPVMFVCGTCSSCCFRLRLQ